MVEMGKEQRGAQLCRVRDKEKEDKGGMGMGGGLLLGFFFFVFLAASRTLGRKSNFRAEGQLEPKK